jgi:AcrR family transcriptional regulator
MAVTIQHIDPRVRRTRQLLQQALLELLKEKRFSSISIYDITRRAAVNRATFYAHFSDKVSLLDTLIREEMRTHLAKQVATDAKWTTRNLRKLIEAAIEFFVHIHTDYGTSATVINPMLERAAQEEIYSYLLKLLQNTEYHKQKPDIPAEIMAQIVSWAIFGSATQGAIKEREPLAQQVYYLLSEGLLHLSPGLVED